MIVPRGMNLEQCAIAFVPVLYTLADVFRHPESYDPQTDFAGWCEAMGAALNEAYKESECQTSELTKSNARNKDRISPNVPRRD